MQRNIFSPRFDTKNPDGLSEWFAALARVTLVLLFVFLPLLFLPNVAVSLGLVKTFFVALGVYLALIFICLAALRRGRLNLTLPLPIIVFWVFLGVATASALLSGDTFDSFYGVALDVHSVSFLFIFALAMSLAVTVANAKGLLIRFFLGTGAVLLLVCFFTLIKLFVGTESLSFGVFTGQFLTLVGGLNDLALYIGLALILLLAFINRLPQTLIARVLLTVAVAISLVLLAIINFSFVWVVVGMMSVLTFVYLIAKDTWLKSDPTNEAQPVSRFTLTVVGGLCLVAGSFIVSGEYLGSRVAALTQLNYLEVRPSVSATTAIGAAVYQQNALLGIGPNRFEDAWRLYRDPVINETQFWNTTFVSGSSYVATLFVTTGVAGALLLVAFLMLVLYYGYRQFFLLAWSDEAWKLIGSATFIAAVYLWVMLFWYTPGATVLLLTAFFTGVALAIVSGQRTKPVVTIDVTKNRQQGFLLITSTVLVLVLATTSIISLQRYFMAQVEFANGVRDFTQTGNVPVYDQLLATVSAAIPEQDTFIAERARLRLAELNRLVAITEPTESDQRLFEQTLVEGIELANEAIARDASNPFNHALLGSFYGLLNTTSLPEVAERRLAAFAEAKRLDPQNPEYSVLLAQIANRFGDSETARRELVAALTLKRNYTEALFLSSQLDIQEGNATSAIATTEAIIAIEPYNPGRYFQLGLLRLAVGELNLAATAFETAVALDSNYANARYMLALTYLDLNRSDDALTQLRKVAETNSDNQSLLSLIAQVEGGDLSRPDVGTMVPVADPVTVQQTGEQTVTTEVPDTSLISPINQMSPTTEAEVVAEMDTEAALTAPETTE